jgi:hypothetical protein
MASARPPTLSAALYRQSIANIGETPLSRSDKLMFALVHPQ